MSSENMAAVNDVMGAFVTNHQPLAECGGIGTHYDIDDVPPGGTLQISSSVIDSNGNKIADMSATLERTGECEITSHVVQNGDPDDQMGVEAGEDD